MLKGFLENDSKKNLLKKQLYRYIHKEAPISKVDLAETFQVPQTTMTRMISDLKKKGIIQSCGFGEANGGRPPILYEIVPNSAYIIGIEIARTHVRMILLDVAFKTLDQSDFVLTANHTPERTVVEIIDRLEGVLKNNKISPDLLLGIGIGAVGPLDRETGIILNPEAFPAKGWENVPITSMLKEAFSVPIILNNGASMAAIAEYQHQALSEESILYCINGYGVRCGYMNQSHPLQNSAGDASSFGHITVKVDGRPCPCGKKGCLTAYTSYGAIFQEIKERMTEANNMKLSRIKTFEHLLHALKQEEPIVKDIVLESAYYYGIGIANMANILHPNVVVLHGKLIYQYERYFNEVVRVAREYIYPRDRRLTIRKGSLEETATPIGAAIQVFYTYVE